MRCSLTRMPASAAPKRDWRDRKSTRLNSSHSQISYAVFCLKKKKLTDLTPLQNSTKADAEGGKPFAACLQLYNMGHPLSHAATVDRVKALHKICVRIHPPVEWPR